MLEEPTQISMKSVSQKETLKYQVHCEWDKGENVTVAIVSSASNIVHDIHVFWAYPGGGGICVWTLHTYIQVKQITLLMLTVLNNYHPPDNLQKFEGLEMH